MHHAESPANVPYTYITHDQATHIKQRVQLHYLIPRVQAIYTVLIRQSNLFIDGQDRLVRLQMDNFRLFFCQQTDKPQTTVCTMSKR